MKFITKINRQYFWALSTFLILISVLGYFVLQNIMNKEILKDLLGKEQVIIREIERQNNTPNIDPIIETREITQNEIIPKSYKKIFLKNKTKPYVEYIHSVKIKNRYYLIKLRHSLVQTHDLLMAISLSLLVLLVLSFAILFITTKKLNKTLWHNFKINLREIERFSFKKSQKLKLKQTNILEFDSLNKTIIELTQKLQKDYQILKEFTQNASHELQTPITILSMNLEEILQQKLDKKTFKQVVTTKNAVKRLANLNKSLILLTKIDNQQYNADKKININHVIKRKIQEFKPLIEPLNLSVNFKTEEQLYFKINSELLDILLNNLISNAIKHNKKDGKIKIKTTLTKLKICNTGNSNSLTNSTIFERFTKENSTSYGLGLAIVKRICKMNNLEIQYDKNNLHCFTINILE